MVVVFWLAFSIAVGYWASNWGRSFGGFFFLSLILSPLIGGIVLLFKGELQNGKTIETKDKITHAVSNVTKSSADEIQKYKNLLDNGTITREEFEQKKKQLLNL